MRVLALDTTTRTGSAAIIEDDRVLIEQEGDERRSQAERLPLDLLALLDASGLAIEDIDLFGVATGPGLFTGLRIGIATIQGLALVTGRLIVPVSALSALGEAGSRGLETGAIVGVWMDAYRRDVFSALFRVGNEPAFAPDRLVSLEGPAVGDPGATLERWSRAGLAPAVLIGDGAVRFADAAGSATRVAPPPLAAVIGGMALARARSGSAVGPAAVQPLYVRRPDAELARETREHQETGHVPQN